MDEKAKPRVAAGLGKRLGLVRWHWLNPKGATYTGSTNTRFAL
jgi:hypothetical protein